MPTMIVFEDVISGENALSITFAGIGMLWWVLSAGGGFVGSNSGRCSKVRGY